MSSPNKMTVAAKWTNDCQGKKDYDGSIVRVSTRYWPRGGGVSVMRDGEFADSPDQTICPSATSEIVLCFGDPREGSPDGDYLTLAEKDFTAETQLEVQRDVEEWVQAQYERVVTALKPYFVIG